MSYARFVAAVFANGRLVGSQPLDKLTNVIDEELAAVSARESGAGPLKK